METIILAIIFIAGTVFGSFYTLATYRIPKKQDITHTRSYCPNCNHKLGFFDMFPILSYVLLGGKCRYCGKKISPRYIILEILSGLVFVTIFYLMKIDFSSINTINIGKLCIFGFMALYITFIFITAGIDKENRKIENRVSIFGIVIALMYIAYLCIVEKANIYRYAIYIVFYIILLILDTISIKKYAKSNYANGLLTTLITMAVFTKEIAALLTVEFTVLLTILYIVSKKIKDIKYRSIKKDDKIVKNINFAFLMCVCNIITFIGLNIFVNIMK